MAATVVNLQIARMRKMRSASPGGATRGAYPRVSLDDPVLVTLFNGMIVRMRLGDLSIDGIKLRTSRIVAEALHPTGEFIDIDNAPKTEVFLDLPLPGGELRVRVRCRIARFERISPDETTFTLHFITFEGAGEAIVGHYVDLCLAPSMPRTERRARVIALDGREMR